MDFKPLHAGNVELAETPVWDARAQKWLWTDLFTGDVHFYHPSSGGEEVVKTGELIGSAIPCDDENYFFAALDSGMYVVDAASGKKGLIANPESNGENRYNDTRIDARGRIFTSSVSKLYGGDNYRPDMLGAFYMVDTDKTVHTVTGGINQYNAIVWTGDNKKMYVIDTYRSKLVAFDYDLGSGPSGQRDALDFSEQGMPDGMSIDEDDNIYVCHWTGKISVWDKALSLKEVIEFPVEQVCCGGFGGADMKDFCVASARYGYTVEQQKAQPDAGGLFMARNKIPGRPDHFYKINQA